ncbi:unnamed protein product [Sphenostylis stenocarpa]|uniref:Uncharacterized protein n=1 Tax=Sphenostylis stenocarpa TaxID=92480 RepID=A0AA86T7Y5_9FABA|nr:unnamed protein product [Sphenostylis stenocarpa]
MWWRISLARFGEAGEISRVSGIQGDLCWYGLTHRNRNCSFFDRGWNMGSLCTMSFQKEHLLHRPTTCTSWKVLQLIDKHDQTLKPCNLISTLLSTLLLVWLVNTVEFRN